MKPLLLMVAFLLPPRAWAGEIIGGQEARPHSHPYMAYLLTQTPVGLGTCGGFLVREDFVLTAARCWGSPINVILGAHNIERLESTQQRISVLRAIRHPEYDQQTNLNDIMLLQLENSARLNRNVRPITLPLTPTRPSPGTKCTVAGWGLVGPYARTDVLQDVRLRVQRDQECSDRFDFYTRQTQICVGDPRKRKSTFLGDTGGPLVCQQEAKGIVSYVNRMGAPPAVFTSISSFLPWIRRTMRRFNQWGQTETPRD
ncbi:cathepsin G [Equus przewalskii]|uniref:Cathepsin G n=2 Tax=Equus TaxID=9789 RepID=A0A5F5PKL6_HORSE|nr:cathepsin G [Equus caballus]